MDVQRKLELEKKRIQRDIDGYEAALKIPVWKFYASHTLFFTLLTGGLILLLNEYPSFEITAFGVIRHFLIFLIGGIAGAFCIRTFYRWHLNKLRRKLAEL